MYKDDLEKLYLAVAGDEQAASDMPVTVKYLGMRKSESEMQPLREVALERIVSLVIRGSNGVALTYFARPPSVALRLHWSTDHHVYVRVVNAWHNLKRVPRHSWWRRLAYVFMPTRFSPDRVKLVPRTRQEHYASGRTAVGRAWHQHRVASIVTGLIITAVGSAVGVLVAAWLT
ncbi:hypothetical protein [Phytoactinopolyspora mesophila]|uniref:Uncharacterized protein n=1 Tax=Phytoactinopolyspora mesophila TaxID=2650750 RepID=A0A7K3M136_9ACTN|nr:hypothetical protein [Phytoactinopolyspora mesophila]NDL57011.1 hypothetical protein [Phytoactinopolyspora mesophila]